MKQNPITLFIAILLFYSNISIAQVAINRSGLNPDESAILDVSSTEKGMLIPRMEISERDAIDTPATGLMIFATDDNRFYVYNGTSWEKILSGIDGGWIVSGDNLIAGVTGNVGIGNTNPEGKLLVTNGTDTLLGVMNDRLKVGTGAIEFYNSGASRQTDIQNGLFRPQDNTIALVTGFQERLRITPDGSIGIGTINPAGDLDLVTAGSHLYENTNFRLSLFSDGANAMPRISFVRSHSPVLGDETSGSAVTLDEDVLGRMTFGGIRVNGEGGSSSTAGWFEMIQKGSTYPSGVPGQFQITTSNGLGNRDTRFVVSPNGNVGIGTTNPGAKLDVNGDIDVNNNQIKNFRIENRSSDPATPAVGQIWIRTDL